MTTYDFPQRLRTPGAARRELRKLTRALDNAADQHTAGYLQRRRARARTAANHLGYRTEPTENTQ